MNVSDEFQKIGILLAQDRLVPVLEKMPVPTVTQIEADRIPGQKPAHQSSDWSSPCSQEEVKVIGEDGPGIARCFCSLEVRSKPFQKIIAVIIIEEDLAPVDPPTDDVMKSSGDIDSCFSGHESFVSEGEG
jgi:hypothetical protein